MLKRSTEREWTRGTPQLFDLSAATFVLVRLFCSSLPAPTLLALVAALTPTGNVILGVFAVPFATGVDSATDSPKGPHDPRPVVLSLSLSLLFLSLYIVSTCFLTFLFFLISLKNNDL